MLDKNTNSIALINLELVKFLVSTKLDRQVGFEVALQGFDLKSRRGFEGKVTIQSGMEHEVTGFEKSETKS